tara:strand:- start:909 stop:1706 length:798 start_codon:yes stop_codon:yes gene_type:complete
MAYTTANWVSTSDPKLASTYSDIITYIRRRDEDVARQFNDDDNTELSSNHVTGTIRWDGTNKKWLIRGSSSWADLVASGSQYAIDVTTVHGCTPNNAAGANNLARNNNALQNNLISNYLGASSQDAAFFRNAGNLNAGTVADARLPASISSDITGNAATFTVSANNTNNENIFPLFVDGATGSQGAETDTGFTYNPSTGNLTATKFTGSGASLTGVGADITTQLNNKQATLTNITDTTTSNGYGTRTVSTGAASGGSNGDVWYQY